MSGFVEVRKLSRPGNCRDSNYTANKEVQIHPEKGKTSLRTTGSCVARPEKEKGGPRDPVPDGRNQQRLRSIKRKKEKKKRGEEEEHR